MDESLSASKDNITIFSPNIISCKVGVDQLLDKLYELYSDYALKNPFYSLEMPIRKEYVKNIRENQISLTLRNCSMLIAFKNFVALSNRYL